MRSSFSLLLVALALGCTVADKVPDFVVQGKCPYVDEYRLWEHQKPNLAKFGGVWFQYALTKNPYQLLSQCVRLQYDFNGEGFDATATGISYEGSLLKRYGNISPMPLGDPHLMVDFENSFAAPLVILDTDYNNYACLYSCIDNNFGYYSDFAFIFTRNPTHGDTYAGKCEVAFTSIGLDTSRFYKTAQGANCPYETQETL
ncbi:crustacyanin-C1 subunit-like [Macrobrachium nipponense]|uniref:crustacyanin-C1 subunit-like n=1 Tax=Macrobrachium nipponense TaxID=159736 RepID=UPI0030C7DED0